MFAQADLGEPRNPFVDSALRGAIAALFAAFALGRPGDSLFSAAQSTA
jgi:hypothetical protein